MTPTEELNHPSWEAAGWQREPVRAAVVYGHSAMFEGLKHPDAPGLALVAFKRAYYPERVVILHVGTGTDSGLFYFPHEAPKCAVFIRDACIAACERIDYVSIDLETAHKIPENVRDEVRLPFLSLPEHKCDACAWWHDAKVPERIADLEAEIENLKDAVMNAQDALAAAEEELHAAIVELAELKETTRAR